MKCYIYKEIWMEGITFCRDNVSGKCVFIHAHTEYVMIMCHFKDTMCNILEPNNSPNDQLYLMK